MKALITGASRGLGLALARTLAADGWDLVIDARGDAGLQEAAAELRAAGARAGRSPRPVVTAVPGDLADPAHRAALVRAADGLDLLVNNASVLGTTPLPPLSDQPIDAFAHVLTVNTVAPLALIQGVLPALRERRGAIVNISSDAAVEAYAGWGGYGASKAALDQLSNVLAAEEPAVRVWSVDPGEMRTAMLAAAGEDAAAAPLPEEVAVPAVLRLIADRPAGGRYTASVLAAAR